MYGSVDGWVRGSFNRCQLFECRGSAYLGGVAEGSVRERRHEYPAYLVDPAHLAIVHEHVPSTVKWVAVRLVDALPCTMSQLYLATPCSQQRVDRLHCCFVHTGGRGADMGKEQRGDDLPAQAV